MVKLPENEVTEQDMAAWYTMQKELSALRVKEMLLRIKIFKAFFPDPREGTNSFTLPDGFVLKGKHNITREVDVAAIGVLRGGLQDIGISVDALIQWKPSLKLAEYRTLTEEQMKAFDNCLVIKPGSPALEIADPPKRRGKAGEVVDG